jgi:Carboxypeptidase regulatory-like domain/TonB dependent receptor-like, beta-barrel
MHADCVVAACWAFLLATAPPAMAGPGSFGSIEGIVTDQQRARVPDAAIRARNVVTDVQFTTSTNNRGIFWFPEIPVGTYELQVVKNGFASWIQKDVIVNIGARVPVRAELITATVKETTEVRPLKPLLESTRSQVSTTIDERAVADLPVNGRNFLDLILLTPGATIDPRGAIIFAGQRKAFGVIVDGGENNDTYFGDPMGNGDRPQYSLDAIGEFQVNTSSYSAELGHTGGGLVNVVTKSGGNAFHGSAFAYYRDKSLNAIDLINKLAGQPKSPYNFTQFGGTFGGPVRRNCLFVFGDYEGQQSRTENVVELNLPARFTQSSGPIVNDFQQRAVDYLRERASSWIRTADQHLMFVKGDWSFGSSSLLTVRANRQRFTGEGQESAAGGPQVSSEHTGTSLIDRDTVGGALTSAISPSWLNVARVTRVESRILGIPNTASAEASVSEMGQLVLTIGRIPIDPREIAIRRFEWSDTLSHRRGSHLVKIGLTGLQDEITFRTAVIFSGTYRFDSLESFGRSLAESPLPLPNERYIQAFSGDGTPGVSVYPDRVDFTAFVQDEWRVTPALTVNAGVRDDMEALARPPVRNPSPALAAAGLDTSFVPRRRNYVAPRIGVAWTPAASDRLVLRGGYGMFYGRTLSLMSARAHFQNGLTVATRTFSGTGPTAALIPAYPNSFCGPPDSSGTPPSCAAPGSGAPSILMLFDRSYVAPLFHQASSGLDLKIHQDTIFSLSYLLARGVQLTRLRDVNLGASTVATIALAGTGVVLPYSRFAAPRPMPEFDRVFVFESGADSTYHALTLQVARRFVDGIQFLGSYTLSKVVDDNPDPAAITPPTNDALLVSDATAPERDRSYGNADQRHRVVFSGLLDLHSTGWRPQGVGAILADWKLSGILRAQSGQPYSGVLNFDLNNDGNQATDRAPGVTRNTFRFPANVAVDVRVTRAFPLGNGHRRLELSWDAFNLFNRANIVTVQRQQFKVLRSAAECGDGVPQCLVPNQPGPGAFGTPTETAGPRIMQLAARFVF